ncbi:MAG: hypothetical protein FJ206_08490 [Gemmatimonadetes bacterium]|nr:hypothetical protein [Gemmatimonadota bacterium]
MSIAQLRSRLIAAGSKGRYDLFWTLGLVLAVVGLGLFGYAYATGHAERAWQLFHVNWIFFTGIAAGSVAIAAVHKLANAKWSGVLIRFAQANVFFAVVSLAGAVLMMTVGYQAVFGHMHEQLHSLPHGKAVWLSHPFMAIRLIGGLLAMFGVGWALIKADMIPDMHAALNGGEVARRDGYQRMVSGYDPAAAGAHQARINRLAAGYVVLYALVMTIIAFDGIMALQPHWFSNLLGGWYFMGSFLGAHTCLALMMIYGQRQLGIADLVSPKQRHDLGKLCFGFTVFWTYLMWSQFLVIWYGNLPEETGFVFARLWGDWMPVGRAVFVGMFLVPFFGLLFVATKKTQVTLGLFAAISFVSLWVERYLLVLPSVTAEHGPVFGLPEVGPTALMLGLFLLCHALFARRFPMISPRLALTTLTIEAEHGHGHEFGHEEKETDYAHPKELTA